MRNRVCLAILCFILPIVGWILCLCLRRRHREAAAVCSKWSTIGFGVQVLALMILSRSIRLIPTGQYQ